MKLKFFVVLIAITATLGWRADAQTYDTNGDYVQTFAGSGFSGYLDGVGQLTMFNNPSVIAADSSNNLFVLDAGNDLIRKIAPDGTVTTFAGGGSDSPPGYGTNVVLYLLFNSMTIDKSNVLWIPGHNNVGSSVLFCISNNSYVSTVATGISPASTLSGICVDSSNNIYCSDYSGNHIYRRNTGGTVAVFAGSGNSGYADGNGIFSAFRSPSALACDQANNIYVWDSGNYLIRRIDQSQNVTTLAGKYQNSSSADGVGTNTAFNSIYQMSVDGSGNLILACGSCIRKITATTNVVTMAGSFTQSGYANGFTNLAQFNGADGVCISGGTIYVADSSNQRIRSITNNPQPQVVSGANLGIGTFAGLTISGIVGRTYQIQSSPNMNTWTTRATVLLTSSPYLWIDQNPIAGNKFYQAVLLP
jgi:hypothetical protein